MPGVRRSYLKGSIGARDSAKHRYRLSDLRSVDHATGYKGYKPHPNGWAVSRERMKRA